MEKTVTLINLTHKVVEIKTETGILVHLDVFASWREFKFSNQRPA